MRRLSIFSKLILFFTSYIPLGIICLIIDYGKFKFPFFKHGTLSITLFALLLLFPIFLFFLIRHFNKKPSGWEKMKVINVRNLDSEILAYIFTYILPFLGFPSERRLIVSLFLLLIIGILYIRSDMIGINPLLAVCGYHIIKIELTKDNWSSTKEATLLSKVDYFQIKYLKYIDVMQIHNEIYIYRRM